MTAIAKNRKLSVADRSTSRSINLRALVNYISQSDGISKADLAKNLGLSKPAVSANVADLISLGLVEETEAGQSGKNGGRRPIILRLNKSLKCIGALDLSLQEPVCAIGDLSNWILKLRRIKISPNATSEEKRKCIADNFCGMLSELAMPIEKMGMIVVSHPGVIGEDNESFYVVERHRTWTNMDIKAYLKDYFKVPVLLENDNCLAAIGEMHLGQEEQMKDLIYVSCGSGFGGGVIINGKLFKGCNFAAGEMGSMVNSDGKSVEDSVAIDGLISRIEAILPKKRTNNKIDFKQVVEMVKARDLCVTQVVRDVGREIGRVINNSCILFGIPIVVFGGDYLKLGQPLFEGIEEAMLGTPFLQPTVTRSKLKESAAVFGCFIVGRNEIIRQKLQEI